MTTGKLTPQDTDGAYDVYDAHECTSESPCFTPASASPTDCTSPEACRPAPAPQPSIFTAPASATFNGPGKPSRPPPRRPAVKPKTAEQVRIEKLDLALRLCRRKTNRHRRALCERAARRQYVAKSSNTTRKKAS